MDHFLQSGAVLPFGLLSQSQVAAVAGFNKSYKNVAMRIGVVLRTYGVSDPNNFSKLTNEYDVLVFEQEQDQGSTPVTYRNCMSAEGLGSIADFFEKSLRNQTVKSAGNLNTAGQDGAIVLLLCLDGMSDKAIIIGAITHPNRQTTLDGSAPHLEGEFNGIHIVVNADGSAAFTFKGATNNQGEPIYPSQGNTVISVATDGSYQVMNKGVTQLFSKAGDVTLTAQGGITEMAQKDYSVTAGGGINLTATKDLTTTSKGLTVMASGSASFQVQSLSVMAQQQMSVQAQQMMLQAQAMATIQAPMISLSGMTTIGGPGGLPLLTAAAVFMGIGNLGLPVISTAISGFTMMTLAL